MIEITELEGTHFRLPRASVPAGELAAVVAPTVACAREFVDLLFGLAAPRKGAVSLFGQAMDAIDEAGRLALRACGLGIALGGFYYLWDDIQLARAPENTDAAPKTSTIISSDFLKNNV